MLKEQLQIFNSNMREELDGMNKKIDNFTAEFRRPLTPVKAPEARSLAVISSSALPLTTTVQYLKLENLSIPKMIG